MDFMNVLDALFRWIHVLTGVLWVGLLYFFNWVQPGFAATMDAETRKKVIPELMPRALFWFRFGAAATWLTGLLLLMLVYYHGRNAWPGQESQWGPASFVMLAIVFLGVFVYDAVYRTALTEAHAGFWGGWVLATVLVFLLDYAAGFGFRGYAIHLGTAFGTIMAFNVWFRIWPAQRKIIMAVKNGQAPDAALASMASLRSKHNTYLSVPLLFTMISQHATWAASPFTLSLIVLAGWGIVHHLYKRANAVKGF